MMLGVSVVIYWISRLSLPGPCLQSSWRCMVAGIIWIILHDASLGIMSLVTLLYILPCTRWRRTPLFCKMRILWDQIWRQSECSIPCMAGTGPTSGHFPCPRWRWTSVPGCRWICPPDTRRCLPTPGFGTPPRRRWPTHASRETLAVHGPSSPRQWKSRCLFSQLPTSAAKKGAPCGSILT